MPTEAERLATLEEGMRNLRTDIGLLRTDLGHLHAMVENHVLRGHHSGNGRRAIIIQGAPWGIGGAGLAALLMKLLELLTR